MLTSPIIGNIRAFLERVQLAGREVPAYNEIMSALAAAEQPPIPLPPTVPPDHAPPDED